MKCCKIVYFPFSQVVFGNDTSALGTHWCFQDELRRKCSVAIFTFCILGTTGELSGTAIAFGSPNTGRLTRRKFPIFNLRYHDLSLRASISRFPDFIIILLLPSEITTSTKETRTGTQTCENRVCDLGSSVLELSRLSLKKFVWNLGALQVSQNRFAIRDKIFLKIH